MVTCAVNEPSPSLNNLQNRKILVFCVYVCVEDLKPVEVFDVCLGGGGWLIICNNIKIMYFVIEYNLELRLNNKCTINVRRLYVYINATCLSVAASALLECVSWVTFHHYSAACDLNGSKFCHLFI